MHSATFETNKNLLVYLHKVRFDSKITRQSKAERELTESGELLYIAKSVKKVSSSVVLGLYNFFNWLKVRGSYNKNSIRIEKHRRQQM